MHTNDYARTADLTDIVDWFRLSRAELTRLAEQLVPDNTPKCQIRTGHEVLAPGKEVVGVPPSDIAEQLSLTGEEASRIAEGRGEHGLLDAVAYYHLKFEAIHPLTDGNGRVGRYIMARQCSPLHGGRLIDILEGILENRPFYRSAFLAPISDNERHELLVDILSRLIGMSPRQKATTHTYCFTLPKTRRVEGGRFRFVPLSPLVAGNPPPVIY